MYHWWFGAWQPNALGQHLLFIVWEMCHVSSFEPNGTFTIKCVSEGLFPISFQSKWKLYHFQLPSNDWPQYGRNHSNVYVGKKKMNTRSSATGLELNANLQNVSSCVIPVSHGWWGIQWMLAWRPQCMAAVQLQLAIVMIYLWMCFWDMCHMSQQITLVWRRLQNIVP